MGTEAGAGRSAPGERYPAAMARSAARYLRTAEVGTRVVARYTIAGGFTDALGYLVSCDDNVCSIDTRRGIVAVPLANVVAAKQVPEPPDRRPVAGPPTELGRGTTAPVTPVDSPKPAPKSEEVKRQ